jgi:hypothetical protein
MARGTLRRSGRRFGTAVALLQAAVLHHKTSPAPQTGGKTF